MQKKIMTADPAALPDDWLADRTPLVRELRWRELTDWFMGHEAAVSWVDEDAASDLKRPFPYVVMRDLGGRIACHQAIDGIADNDGACVIGLGGPVEEADECLEAGCAVLARARRLTTEAFPRCFVNELRFLGIVDLVDDGQWGLVFEARVARRPEIGMKASVPVWSSPERLRNDPRLDERSRHALGLVGRVSGSLPWQACGRYPGVNDQIWSYDRIEEAAVS